MGTTSSTASTSSSPVSSDFTGSSSFSSSLQAAINQAVAIASAPLNQLTSQQTTLTNQQDEVTTLNSKFSALQSAIQGIDTTLSSSFNTNISDPGAISATVGQGATDGNYSIQVNDPGSYSTMMTGTWQAASGAAQTYRPYIGTREYNVTPADNSAASVAAAINSQYGNLVNATVVNVGSNASPDQRISIQSASLSSDAVDLQDASGNGLAAQSTNGSPAQYEVDQSGTVATSNSPNVTIAAGVTVSLLAATDSPVNVTVTQSTSALSDALSTFVTAYNAAVDEVDAQRGQNAGPLQGQSIVNELQHVLSSISTYTANGGVGLSDLGLQLGQDGHFTFNAMQLDATALTNSAGIDSFLGSATSGGFLQTATNQMNAVEQTGTGLLPAEQTNLQNQLSVLASQISDKQTQVNNLQMQLTTQMSTADASISTMEQQYSYLNEMFQAMQIDAREITG